MSELHHGSCLCGAVRFTVAGPLAPPDACHCTQCRKTSGHYWASTDIDRAALTVADWGKVAWFQSSENVRRGFCPGCGASLFWDPIGRAKIAVAMGAFDDPTGTALHLHIFVKDQGDYYTIADDVPKKE